MKTLIAAIIFAILSTMRAMAVPSPTSELTTWLTTGNPYQVAARCYAAVLFYPSIEYFGEVESLIRIIATDPHLSAAVSLNNSTFAVPTDRGRTLDLVGKSIYYTFGMLRRYTYEPADIEHSCNFFIRQQQR